MTMDSWYRAGHGGINGDEMGLGKTCQVCNLDRQRLVDFFGAVLKNMNFFSNVEGPRTICSSLFVLLWKHSRRRRWISPALRFKVLCSGYARAKQAFLPSVVDGIAPDLSVKEKAQSFSSAASTEVIVQALWLYTHLYCLLDISKKWNAKGLTNASLYP